MEVETRKQGYLPCGLMPRGYPRGNALGPYLGVCAPWLAWDLIMLTPLPYCIILHSFGTCPLPQNRAGPVRGALVLNRTLVPCHGPPHFGAHLNPFFTFQI